jgi:hypothetical protein
LIPTSLPVDIRPSKRESEKTMPPLLHYALTTDPFPLLASSQTGNAVYIALSPDGMRLFVTCMAGTHNLVVCIPTGVTGGTGG